ncbi:glycosyltransferase [Anoxybacterium hadale]|uniref:Glycosyltransferase n=1 Tax=Anoxybacterium hadale TaxID=3408580 RepID=A0ACD1AFD6_9FIRM|nr:glycosyltransferase [Clostridiales bacterium]
MNFIPSTLHSVLTGLLWFTSFLLILYGLYYFVIALFSVRRLYSVNTRAPENKFAILIAARNEAEVIEHLIRSLKLQDYPKELYEIFVIPNNCTDKTKEIAEIAGASILTCPIKTKSKGEVLSFAVDTFLNSTNGSERFDAFCIFDADNLVHPNFLREMNHLLCSGAHAAQGRRESKNPTDTIISSCYTIYYNSLNRLYNHSRSALGLSSVVNGTGFMFSTTAIRNLGGWQTGTLTEDLEFSALCALNGIRIHWSPNAVVYDEQPLTFVQSWHQRKRWSSGMQQCLRKYWQPLLRSAVKRRNLHCLDILLMFLATHVQVVGFLSFVLTLLLSALNISYSLFPQTDLAFRLFLSFDTSYFAASATAVAALMLERKSLSKHLWGILFTWLFLTSWIPINLLCLFHKSEDWKPIDHVKGVSLKEVLSIQSD